MSSDVDCPVCGGGGYRPLDGQPCDHTTEQRIAAYGLTEHGARLKAAAIAIREGLDPNQKTDVRVEELEQLEPWKDEPVPYRWRYEAVFHRG